MMSRESDRHLVEQAVECINRLLRSGFNHHGEVWIKAWFRHDLKWSDSSPEYVTIPEHQISSLISATQMDREVFDLACFVVGTRLIVGATIPVQLREFAGKLLTGLISRPSGRRGRGSQWGRNCIIIRTMNEINPGTLFDGEDARHPTANLDQRGKRRGEVSAMEIVHALAHLDGWRELGKVRRHGKGQMVWFCRGEDGPLWVPAPEDEIEDLLS